MHIDTDDDDDAVDTATVTPCQSRERIYSGISSIQVTPIVPRGRARRRGGRSRPRGAAGGRGEAGGRGASRGRGHGRGRPPARREMLPVHTDPRPEGPVDTTSPVVPHTSPPLDQPMSPDNSVEAGVNGEPVEVSGCHQRWKWVDPLPSLQARRRVVMFQTNPLYKGDPWDPRVQRA